MKNFLKFFLLVFILVVFSYLRLKPIINETVPYTYDQGRDFLKAEEIVRFKNITFLGPTTGIIGVNHGAWWYYLVSIPYFFFNGQPMSFYYFMFFLSLVFNLLFFYFLKKEFGFYLGLLFLTIVSISSYFISFSFSVSNNIIIPYLILSLIILTYYLFKTKDFKWLFFISLALGFIHEFEVSFGLFIIPIFTFLLLLNKTSKKILLTKKGLIYYFFGFFLSFLPRTLFEVKHQFIQTKVLINFFFQPKLHNPKPFLQIFSDRVNLFHYYFNTIFPYQTIATIILIFIFICLIFFRKKIFTNNSVKIFIYLTLFLFAASLFYKDNFWANYYEGIQYIFLFIFLFIFYLFSKKFKLLANLFIIFYLVLNLSFFIKEINNKEKPIKDFKAINKTVLYIYDKEKNQPFCVRVYTPPVIPYTYNYLFSYYAKIKNIDRPTNEFINKKCYFIIENDVYDFRLKKWLDENIPKNGKKIIEEKINKDIQVQLWKTD